MKNSNIEEILEDFKNSNYYLNEAFKDYMNSKDKLGYENLKSKYFIEKEIIAYYDNIFYKRLK
jgi:hypothetical protein